MRRKACHSRRREGAALLEMAVVLPIFLAVILGIIEFGRVFTVQELVTNSSRTGVRLAVLPFVVSNTEVEASVKSALTAGSLSVEDVEVKVLVNGAEGSLASAVRGDEITVQTSVPFSKVSLIAPNFLASHQVVGATVMRRE